MSLTAIQISVFGAIAIVFAVIGVNEGIFTDIAAFDAMAAGWLVLAVVDVSTLLNDSFDVPQSHYFQILWVLYFTSEEDSLMLHIFNMMGTGGLTPPSRRSTRRHTRQLSNGQGNGYGYGGGGISSGAYDNGPADSGSLGRAPGMQDVGGGGMGSLGVSRSNPTIGSGGGGGMGNTMGGGMGGGMSSPPQGGGPDAAPLITNSGASPAAANPALEPGAPGGQDADPAGGESYLYRAKALYACE